jgi:hypothetical protein
MRVGSQCAQSGSSICVEQLQLSRVTMTLAVDHVVDRVLRFLTLHGKLGVIAVVRCRAEQESRVE